MTDEANATAQEAAATAATSKEEEPYSPEDLIALIRAVKFAHPEMSQRSVHTEIATVVADSDPTYAFLKKVKLNDVKKVWKKALKGGSDEENSYQAGSEEKEEPSPILPPSAANNGILKFYTVGDGSVQTLVENYANHHARAEAAAAESNTSSSSLSQYTHFFLDVPADKSGSRPHQALINFNDNKSKASCSNNKQKKKKNHATTYKQQGRGIEQGDGRQIFKIQMAAPVPGMENTPMLLYNANKDARTFLHPPSSSSEDKDVEHENEKGGGGREDDGGYFILRQMIENSGTGGALGKSGGIKAYFWGVVNEVKGKRRVVTLDLSALAPSQDW
jgi:hypothetical protein